MDNKERKDMDLCATGETSDICWFCRKGRYEDCMKEIPIHGNSDGPHDCTFDVKLVRCRYYDKYNKL